MPTRHLLPKSLNDVFQEFGVVRGYEQHRQVGDIRLQLAAKRLADARCGGLWTMMLVNFGGKTHSGKLGQGGRERGSDEE
jgi:hypothetical protein